MKTIKNNIKKIKDLIFEKQIRYDKKVDTYLRNLSLRSRLIFISCMLLFMGLSFIGMIGITIIQLEKESVQQIELEHIRGLELQSKSDTINFNKTYDYGRER